jgi:hypothetical protein
MNLLSSERAGRTDRSAPDEAGAAGRLDAAGLLTFYLFLVMVIPSSEVFAPLGAAGGPATLFAVMLMASYLVMRVHPGLELDTSPQPARVAGILFLRRTYQAISIT